jgi:hypothetical protein
VPPGPAKRAADVKQKPADPYHGRLLDEAGFSRFEFAFAVAGSAWRLPENCREVEGIAHSGHHSRRSFA